jgi:UDP-MurNAc hydroxylase
MRVTSVGHAGFFVETAAGSILCDPWVNPAYFASWFPFPDNSRLDWDRFGACDFLYISHLHKDHFDPRHLARYVNKDATVLLPEYPVPDLQRALEGLGFHDFFETKDSVKHVIVRSGESLEVMIMSLTTPADGPLGDSALCVSDGQTTVFNMNDARPVDLTPLHENFAAIDIHMLQFSGAIWYPMVYDMPERAKEAFGSQKRQRGMDRCRQYITDIGATWVIPSAGPPCFLDDELRTMNDVYGDPSNIFPDQVVFIEQMERHGNDNGLLMMPGSTADLAGARLVSRSHPIPDDDVIALFTTAKAEHIQRYADRMQGVIEAEKANWAPHDGIPLIGALRAKFEPIMALSDQVCDGIGYPVALNLGAETVVLDFPKRVVRECISGERFRYEFDIDPALVRTVLRDDEPDWSNSIFLSLRFAARRVGGYNEFLYTFFKCLSAERIAYADGWFAESHDDSATTTMDGWEIQRRCPHLKADLTKFGQIEGGTLTCDLHGWKWDLVTGRCLTSKGHLLRAHRCTDT